jgi:bacterioferritin-associated ferredoxin
MYVCICNAVTEKQVKHAALEGASSLEDLQMDLGVATCCGQCADNACQLLKGARQGSESAQTATV